MLFIMKALTWTIVANEIIIDDGVCIHDNHYFTIKSMKGITNSCIDPRMFVCIFHFFFFLYKLIILTRNNTLYMYLRKGVIVI
jgi:hypothetical protein